MRKGVLVLVLLALALVVAGCQGGKSATSSSSTPFIGGSEGLRISFVENAPPSEVLDNKQTPFDITLRVENVGEMDMAKDNVKTTIGGLYPIDFGKSSLEYVLPRSIQGVKKDPEGGKINGGIDEITFLGLSYQKALEGNNVFPIQADTCYTYQTRAVGDYCMRQDLTRVTPGVCNVKGSKPIFNSGGPVQVVSLSESVGGRNTIILSFTIKTVGSGSFFKPAARTCIKGDLQSESFVKVTVEPGIAGKLRCSGWGEGVKTKDVRLVNGEASVTCILEGINVDALQKINIKLDYNNLISTSTSLLVKHLPGDTLPSITTTLTGGSQTSSTVTERTSKCQNTGGSWVSDSANPPCNCNPGSSSLSKTWGGFPAGCIGAATTTCTPGRQADCTFETIDLNVQQKCPGVKTCAENGQWSMCTDNPTKDFCPVTKANIDEVKEQCENPTASKGRWDSDLFKCVCPDDMPNYQVINGRCEAAG